MKLTRTSFIPQVARGARACLALALLACAACAQLGGSTRGEGNSPRPPRGNGAPLVYVAIGDSTGIGLGARNGGGYVERLFEKMRAASPGARLVNLSRVGAATADALQQQLPRVPADATIITVGVGANDVMGEVDEESFANAYESLVAKARQTGASVVAMTIPDLNAAHGIPPPRRAVVASRVEKFNRRIEEAAARSGILLVDLYRAGGKKPEVGSNFFSPDGLHPSDEGYAFWAGALWEKIEPALGGR